MTQGLPHYNTIREGTCGDNMATECVLLFSSFLCLHCEDSTWVHFASLIVCLTRMALWGICAGNRAWLRSLSLRYVALYSRGKK